MQSSEISSCPGVGIHRSEIELQKYGAVQRRKTNT
jgi:hypothetical protein